MDDEPAVSRTTTDPLPLSHGERVLLENRLEEFKAWVGAFMNDTKSAREAFYAHRLVPLELRVSRLHAIAWFALGFASCACIGVAVLACLLLIHHV